MRKPFLHLASVILLLLFATLPNSYSEQSPFPEIQECNELFDCGTAQSPFTVGQQYFYSFDLESTVDIGGIFFGSNSASERSIQKNGSFMITPLSSCEILIGYGYEGKTSMQKVAFENGNIRRTCSSNNDATNSVNNMLRALSSMLQGNFERSTDTATFPEKLENGIILENDSQGTCLTKFVQCSTNPNKFIKYKLKNHCGSHVSTDILQNINLKGKEFEMLTNQLPELCESSDVINPVNGLVTCIIERGNGMITSSTCVEAEENSLGLSKSFSSASLKLEKVGKNGTPPKDLSFYMAGQQQQNRDVMISIHSNDIQSEESLFELDNSIRTLANATARKEMNMMEVQILIDKVKQHLHSQSDKEPVSKYLNELILTSSDKEIVLLLKISAEELRGNGIMNFLQEAISTDFVKNELSLDDREEILSKAIKSLSPLKFIDGSTLQFSKFISDYANDYVYSPSLKLKALTKFSKNLNMFCERMELTTGENFCLKNDQIQNWISSILNKLETEENPKEKLMLLETFSNFQRYSKTSCKDLLISKSVNSQNLWKVLNCYQNDACNKEGKAFQMSLLRDSSTSTNVRIAAFLAIIECPDNDDLTIIRGLINSDQAENSELRNFMKIHLSNKVRNRMLEPEHEEETGISNTRNHQESQKPNKLTQASNTLLTFKIPKIPANLIGLLETNILYFDEPAIVPQLITAKLAYGVALSNSTIVPKWNDALQVEILVDDNRSSKEPINFHLTIILRAGGSLISIKEMSFSQREILQFVSHLQEKVRRNNRIIESILVVLYYQFLTVPENINELITFNILDANKISPTISGLHQTITWKLNGLRSFSFEKDDCSYFQTDEDSEESVCQFDLRPDLNFNGQIYVGTGSEDFQTGFLFRSNISASLPLKLLLTRDLNELSKSSAKLILPSSISQITRGNVYKLYGVEVKGNGINSMQEIHSAKFGCLQQKPMKIELKRSFGNITITVHHPTYEAVLEATRDSQLTIRGNFTCLVNPTSPSVTFEASTKNSETDKKLYAKLNRGKDEYLLDTYYYWRILEDDNQYRGSFSCRGGRGVLCRWPFCLFCNTEYFSGAIVSTPTYKNIKLFEASITQDVMKTISILIKTGGVPLIKNGQFKLTASMWNDTSIFQTSKLRESLDGKLAQLFPPVHNSDGGDALPEIEASRSPTSEEIAASLDVELTSEVLGHGALSIIYAGHFDKGAIYGAGLFYGYGGEEQKITFLSSVQYQNSTVANVSKDYINKAHLRCSQFPIVNTDLTVHGQEFLPSPLVKRVIIIKPLNLLRGEIRTEIIDKTGEKGSFRKFFESRELDIHLDRTYKVYLPKNLPINIFKGKIILKRTNEILEEAGIESLVGFDHAFEIKYERHSEEYGNSYKLLSSVITGGETYGIHHRIEQMPESSEIDDNNLLALDDDETSLGKYKYRGTYIFGDASMKALGFFLARKGREILPFSKFGIRLTPVDAKDEGPRIIGSEIIHDDTHSMQLAINKGDNTLFELKSEISPLSPNPIKATISVKDYAEVKIQDNSKFTNTRNLQVKAKWIPKKKVVVGKISFPTSLEQLYLDLDISIANEGDREIPVFKLTSRSSVEFGSNASVSTQNVLQIQQSKWEAGLACSYLTESEDRYSDEEQRWVLKNLQNASFNAHYIPPSSSKYGVKLAGHHLSTHLDSSDKIYVNIERPHVTPLLLHLEATDRNRWDRTPYDTDDSIRNETDSKDLKITVKFCHKDNFIYLFPSLNTNFSIQVSYERSLEKMTDYTLPENPKFSNLFKGRNTCKAEGIHIPYLCNQIDSSYVLKSDHGTIDGKPGPWLANFTAINKKPDRSEEVNLKLRATYDPVRPAERDHEDIFSMNMIEIFLNTVVDKVVYKNIYNIDYDVQTKDVGTDLRSGINGTYIITKMYESVDFFEFSDELRWSQMHAGTFNIWTNLLNHSSDSNLTSSSATFSSQYVSLGEADPNANNITWMELRTTLNSNGFGTLQTLILNPSIIFSNYEGNLETDFLIRTEFSPLKTLRVSVSHEQSKTESEEDDDSIKYGALTRINGIFNSVEVSGSNSITVALGKLIGVGNSMIGRYRAPNGIYEYVTIKTFAVAPALCSESGENKLVHFDIASSWTNADDDDTDLRIINDVIYSLPLRELPTFRMAYFKNSSDLELEKNGSLFAYRSVAGSERKDWLRLPDHAISEGFDELSFTQLSLQSVSQQIIDDYTNAIQKKGEDSSTNEEWHDYNFEVRSRSVVQNNSSSSNMLAKWIGFKEKLYHCQSFTEKCTENEEFRIDTSNYCNLLGIFVRPVIYLSS